MTLQIVERVVRPDGLNGVICETSDALLRFSFWMENGSLVKFFINNKEIGSSVVCEWGDESGVRVSRRIIFDQFDAVADAKVDEVVFVRYWTEVLYKNKELDPSIALAGDILSNCLLRPKLTS